MAGMAAKRNRTANDEGDQVFAMRSPRARSAFKPPANVVIPKPKQRLVLQQSYWKARRAARAAPEGPRRVAPPAPQSSGIVVATTGSLRAATISGRGQAKSSARPAGGATASPRMGTLFANSSNERSWAFAPKSSSKSKRRSGVKDTIGPASGRVPGSWRVAGNPEAVVSELKSVGAGTSVVTGPADRRHTSGSRRSGTDLGALVNKTAVAR
jgi:hypothetical protein